MRIEITQQINEAYYEEYYAEWLSARSRFRKWEHLIGFTSVLLSLVIYFADNTMRFIAAGLLIFGLLMIYEFYSSKRKWLNDRLKGNMKNAEVTMIFEEDSVRSIGPFSEMSGTWSLFSDAVETKKGLILILENGVNIYLQKQSFGNQSDVNEILKRIKTHKTS